MDGLGKRLREVRKALKLSQDEFGARLGFTRGVVTNSELERAAIRPLYIQQVCKEFGVNYDWLMTGTGEMFENLSDGVLLDEIAANYNLNQKDIAIVQAYLELSTEERQILKKFISVMAKKIDPLV